MGEAEEDTYDLLQRLSKAGESPIVDGLHFAVDYRAMSHRMDPMEELAYWKELRANGLRSIVDDALALNPELDTEAEAWEEITRNMADEAVYITQRRALNIADDASVETPGQNPKTNGAMGPKVKSGEMTRDEAAAQAKDGPPPKSDSGYADEESLARKFLGKKKP
jgi:hypothetical protein